MITRTATLSARTVDKAPSRARVSTFTRAFSLTSSISSHYDTLSVPHSASKSQIKSSFYKLSKQYHPDVNPAPETRHKYHSITEAYSILVDDRQRRAYDRQLSSHPSMSHPRHAHPNAHPHANPSYDSGEAAFETRRRGATYAWGARRPAGAHPNSSTAGGWRASAHPHGSGWRPAPDSMNPDPLRSPWTSPHVRRATGRRRPRDDMEAEDKVQHINSLTRFIQVGALLFFTMALSGGWSASTG